MDDFNYDKAEADLYDVGCPYSEEIYGYRSEKGIHDFMAENGLDAEKYYNHDDSNNSSNNSGGCYLTTACIEAKGLSDGCLELQTLRFYRDNYLKFRTNGAAEIKEYYTIAPQIVKAINALPNSKAMWNNLYNKLVMPCVDLIKRGHFEEAYTLYKATTLELQSRYIKK